MHCKCLSALKEKQRDYEAKIDYKCGLVDFHLRKVLQSAMVSPIFHHASNHWSMNVPWLGDHGLSWQPTTSPKSNLDNKICGLAETWVLNEFHLPLACLKFWSSFDLWASMNRCQESDHQPVFDETCGFHACHVDEEQVKRRAFISLCSNQCL